MSVATDQLREKLAKISEDGNAITAAALSESRDLTGEELTSVTKALNDARHIADQIRAIDGIDSLSALAGATRSEPVAGRPGTTGAIEQPRQDRRSIGQRFTESDEWTQFRSRVAPNGFSDKTSFGAGPSVQFRSILPPTRAEMRAIITGGSDTSAGALVFNDVQPIVDLGGLQRELTIRDVITIGSTDSDTVEYVRVTGQTNAATPTAESAATSGSGLTTAAQGVKQESNLALAKVTTNVKVIAHYLAATKRAMSDAGQLRTLIDGFLRYGLEEELEDQIVAGDASGENFDGIGHVSGVQSQAFSTDLHETTRKARTKVRLVGRARATAYLFHPNDWEDIDLLKDAEDRYYQGGPQAMGTPMLWGLPVVQSEAVTEGTAYVGDMRKCVLWEREQASIQVSDSHADFFIRNMVAILAEMRAAFGIIQPSAIVEIALS